MKAFDYVRPATVREAVAAASEPGAAYLAAGTNLLDLMKGGVSRPSRLVDISHLPGLDEIEDLADGGVRIGALVRNADLAHDRAFARAFRRSPRRCCPERPRSFATPRRSAAISCSGRAALTSMTSPAPATSARPVRAATPAAATTGCTRCWAGASTASRPTRPISACRWSRSTPSSRSKAKAGGARSRSTCFTGCRANAPDRESVLEPGEMIVAVRLPAEAARFAAHARYLKVRERTSYAFAVVSAAAALRIENATIVEARLALGGVALQPWRAREAEGDPGRQTGECRIVHARRRGGARAGEGRRATTASRSSSRGGSSCAPSPSPQPARRSACPRCRHPRSPPFPEIVIHA